MYLVPAAVGALNLPKAILPTTTAAYHALHNNQRASDNASPEGQPNDIISGQKT
jgi:hypothetical protein